MLWYHTTDEGTLIEEPLQQNYPEKVIHTRCFVAFNFFKQR